MQSTSKRGAKKLHMNQNLITSIIKKVKRCQWSSFDGDPIYILKPKYYFFVMNKHVRMEMPGNNTRILYNE